MIPRRIALSLAMRLKLHKLLLVEQLHDLVFKINTTGKNCQKRGGNWKLRQRIYKHRLERAHVASCPFNRNAVLCTIFFRKGSILCLRDRQANCVLARLKFWTIRPTFTVPDTKVIPKKCSPIYAVSFHNLIKTWLT